VPNVLLVALMKDALELRSSENIVQVIFLSALYANCVWASARYGLPNMTGFDNALRIKKLVDMTIFLMDIGALYTIPANDLKVPLADCILLLPISLGIDVIMSPAACAVLRRIVLSSAPESRRADSRALWIIIGARGQSRRTCS
jgi:hypothetical protein